MILIVLHHFHHKKCLVLSLPLVCPVCMNYTKHFVNFFGCALYASESNPSAKVSHVDTLQKSNSAKWCFRCGWFGVFGARDSRPRDRALSVPRHCLDTVIFEIITFLIQKHFKRVTVTVIWGKLIQMIFKMVIGNQWKWRCDCERQDGNGNGN